MQPNEIRAAFTTAVQHYGCTLLPEKSLLSGNTELFFRVSTALTLLECMRTTPQLQSVAVMQRCMRAKPELLSILGKEGVATIFNTMMSFFLIGVKDRREAFDLLGDFYLRIGMPISEVYCVLSVLDESLRPAIRALGIPNNHVVIVPEGALISTLGTANTGGRYVRFFKPSGPGLAPIGDLNFAAQDSGWLVDSSLLVEILTTVTERAQSMYDTELFRHSLNWVNQHPYLTSSTEVCYRLVNALRAVTAALADGAELSATGSGYVLRKITRAVVTELNIERCLTTDMTPLVEALLADLATLGYTYDRDTQVRVCTTLSRKGMFLSKLMLASIAELLPVQATR